MSIEYAQVKWKIKWMTFSSSLLCVEISRLWLYSRGNRQKLQWQGQEYRIRYRMVVDRSGSEPRSPSSVSLADTDHARRWEGQLSKFTNVVKVVDLITSSDVNIDCQAQSNKLSCHFPPTLIFRSYLLPHTKYVQQWLGLTFISELKTLQVQYILSSSRKISDFFSHFRAGSIAGLC